MMRRLAPILALSLAGGGCLPLLSQWLTDQIPGGGQCNDQTRWDCDWARTLSASQGDPFVAFTLSPGLFEQDDGVIPGVYTVEEAGGAAFAVTRDFPYPDHEYLSFHSLHVSPDDRRATFGVTQIGNSSADINGTYVIALDGSGLTKLDAAIDTVDDEGTARNERPGVAGWLDDDTVVLHAVVDAGARRTWLFDVDTGDETPVDLPTELQGGAYMDTAVGDGFVVSILDAGRIGLARYASNATLVDSVDIPNVDSLPTFDLLSWSGGDALFGLASIDSTTTVDTFTGLHRFDLTAAVSTMIVQIADPDGGLSHDPSYVDAVAARPGADPIVVLTLFDEVEVDGERLMVRKLRQVDGTNLVRVTDGDPSDMIFEDHPSWSSDGSVLAWDEIAATATIVLGGAPIGTPAGIVVRDATGAQRTLFDRGDHPIVLR